MSRAAAVLCRLAMAAALLAGCATEPSPTASPEIIALLTESAPSQSCMLALAHGTLVPDPRSGLALAVSGGERVTVKWPFGYTARIVDGAVELVDNHGVLVARDGDPVVLGGGYGMGDLFYACSGSVQRAGP